MAANKAAWATQAGAALKVDDAPLPTAGPGELVIKNAAVAINPLDWHMQNLGIFVQQWPHVLGCDVAGTVHEVGADVNGRFKVGDRVIAHAINLVTGRASEGAFALYTLVSAEKTAILPNNISFTDGVVLPTAVEAAASALLAKVPGPALPGVSTPALALPYPSLEPTSSGKIIVIYGGSSSIGAVSIQIATAAGLDVIAVAGEKNFDLVKSAGAVAVLDYKDASFVDKIVETVKNSGKHFVGIFDAISVPETYANDLAILAKLGGGHLAASHPPPTDVPDNVKAGMIFAVNDAANAVWREYVTLALEAGKLKALPPPVIVGKGLEHIQEALKKSEAGVSAAKLVVEL